MSKILPRLRILQIFTYFFFPWGNEKYLQYFATILQVFSPLCTTLATSSPHAALLFSHGVWRMPAVPADSEPRGGSQKWGIVWPQTQQAAARALPTCNGGTCPFQKSHDYLFGKPSNRHRCQSWTTTCLCKVMRSVQTSWWCVEPLTGTFQLCVPTPAQKLTTLFPTLALANQGREPSRKWGREVPACWRCKGQLRPLARAASPQAAAGSAAGESLAAPWEVSEDRHWLMDTQRRGSG